MANDKAAEHARQAAGQGKAAAKNAAKAVTEEVQDNVHRLEDTASEAARAVTDPSLIGRIASNGKVFAAASATLFAAGIAYSVFRDRNPSTEAVKVDIRPAE